MPVSLTAARALLATSGVVLVAGAALAIAKPGDLGDDSSDSSGTAAPAQATTTTTVLPGPSETTLTLPGSEDGAATTLPGSATTLPGSATTATTAPSSGLGTGGASVADDATATTGIELDALLGPGLALVAAAAAARTAARRRTA